VHYPELSLLQVVPIVLFGAGSLLAAGWATARLAVVPTAGDPQATAIHRALVTLGVGFGVVPTWAFFGHLLFGTGVSLLAVLLAALSHTALVTVVAHLFGDAVDSRTNRSAATARRLLPWHDAASLRHAARPLGAALAIGLFWYVKHDGAIPSGSCVTQAAAVAAGWDPSGFDLLRGNLGDNRLGNAGVLAGAMAIFGQFSFRALYGLLAVMLALGGWGLGRIVSDKPWAPWLGLFLLPLNPYVASLPLIDENLLALSFSVTFLPLVFGRARWWLVGALFGLCVTMRHPLVLATPAVAIAAWQDRRWRGLAGLAVGAGVLTSVENAHHLLAFGSLLRFESNAYFMPQKYELFGHAFTWQGMMNWPLHSHIVRTPHNPFPTMMMWPLAVADHFGALLAGAMGVGFFAAWRDRPKAVFWLLWFVPVQASLMLQESWDYPNKMGVILIVLAPLVVWVIEGLVAVTRDHRRGAVALVAAATAVWLSAQAANGVRVPADSRYFAHYQLPAQESQTWLKAARTQATDVAIWPDFGRLANYGPVLSASKLADLGAEHLQSHSWGWHEGEVPAVGDSVVLQIDLSEPVWGRADFATVAQTGEDAATASVDVDLVARPARHVVAEIALPWERHNAWLTAVRGPELSVLELGFVPRDAGVCDPQTDQRKCRFYASFAAGIGERSSAAAQVVSVKRPIVRVRLPSGGASFVVSINERGNVLKLWKLVISANAVRTEGPFAFWHN
jgi:hypothetical protein